MRSLMSSVVLFALAACSGPDEPETTDTPVETEDTEDTDTGMPESLEIAGSWTDDFGSEHEIDEVTWTQTYPGYPPYLFHVASWDNAGGWLVAQNDSANGYSADLWSRFDWTWQGTDLYFCQSAFDAASEAAAEAAPAADAGDLGAGCGGFPWTGLLP